MNQAERARRVVLSTRRNEVGFSLRRRERDNGSVTQASGLVSGDLGMDSIWEWKKGIVEDIPHIS
jgi:hypothetical protein